MAKCTVVHNFFLLFSVCACVKYIPSLTTAPPCALISILRTLSTTSFQDFCLDSFSVHCGHPHACYPYGCFIQPPPYSLRLLKILNGINSCWTHLNVLPHPPRGLPQKSGWILTRSINIGIFSRKWSQLVTRFPENFLITKDMIKSHPLKGKIQAVINTASGRARRAFSKHAGWF